MLVAQRYFEVKNLLTVALKTKVTWLNDARVHRSDGNLVNLFAVYPVKIHDPNLGSLLRSRAAGISFGSARFDETDRFEPWVALWDDTPFLGDFAFEKLNLRTFRGHRWE